MYSVMQQGMKTCAGVELWLNVFSRGRSLDFTVGTRRNTSDILYFAICGRTDRQTRRHIVDQRLTYAVCRTSDLRLLVPCVFVNFIPFCSLVRVILRGLPCVLFGVTMYCRYFKISFICAFAKLRKATLSFVMSVRPSVILAAWNNSVTTGGIFLKFCI